MNMQTIKPVPFFHTPPKSLKTMPPILNPPLVIRMALYPVTNWEYRIFVQDEGYPSPRHWKDDQIPAGKERHPVVGVSLWDVQRYCQWLGVRLPTQQEWQLAAAGPFRHLYPWGNQRPNRTLANFNGHLGDTTPVGFFPRGRSHYGLEMAGNVWEWVDSIYQPERGQTNGSSVSTYQILCGGSYVDRPEMMKCTAFNWARQDTVSELIGFRIVLPDSDGQQEKK